MRSSQYNLFMVTLLATSMLTLTACGNLGALTGESAASSSASASGSGAGDAHAISAAEAAATLVPMYRFYSEQTKKHFYGASEPEAKAAGYRLEGMVFQFVGGTGLEGTIPFYRCAGQTVFISTNADCEGATRTGDPYGSLSRLQSEFASVAVYRMYNRTTGDRLVSIDASEGSGLGYQVEGIIGFALQPTGQVAPPVSGPVAPAATPAPAPTSPPTSVNSVAMHRFFNATNRHNMYSASLAEGAAAGSTLVGTAFYFVGGTSVPGTMPIYRCFKGTVFISTNADCEGGSRMDAGAYGSLFIVEGEQGRTPIYRLVNRNNNDYIVGTNPREGAELGYVLEGIIGFAL